MLVEAIAAGVVGAALLWLVLQPIFAPERSVHVDFDPPDPEETPRGQALLALKEIEFDRATGKLSDGDYASLTAKYSAAAVATLDDPAPATGTRCRTHGARAEADALFCADCGAGLVSATNRCVACGTATAHDARFCHGCGVGLVA
jgi:Double zinc ribbon